jgi:DNA polymerase-3 subunit epsilon
MTRQIFLDTETTGLSPEAGDRIIELGCVEMVNRRLTGRNLHFYINPERANSADAVRIHGLTDEFLADKPVFATIVDELMAYVAGAEILIHNAAFDLGFLDAELRRTRRGKFAAQVASVTDTLLMAREMFPGKSNSLDALCKRLEIDNTSRTLHGALLDAGLLAEAYVRMTRGQESLVIEEAQSIQIAGEDMHIDLSRFELLVIPADAADLVAHEAVLADLDKASGGKTAWRLLVE